MLRQVIWALETVAGRQDTSGGSRLVNLFALNTQHPRDARAPIVLHGTPGIRKYLNVPRQAVGRTGGASTLNANQYTAGIQGLVAVDSPSCGRRLFGISNALQFCEVRTGAGNPIPLYHNPYVDGAGDPVAAPDVVTITRARDFTDDPGEGFTGPVRFAEDGRRVVFVVGRSVVMWDMDDDNRAGAFQTVYAPTPENDLAVLADNDWVDVAWIDHYFVLLARNGQIFHSQLNSDTFDQLDFATAESNPDPGVALEVFAGVLWVFGSKTIEAWTNAGTDPFAFAPQKQRTVPIGCAARDTVQVDQSGIHFLGNDRIVYRFVGGAPDRISTETVENDITKSEFWKAYAYLYTEEGRRFYALILTFRGGAKKNWTLDLTTGFWHERSDTSILCMTEFEGWNVAGRAGDSHIFTQALDWGDWDGAIIERQAVSSLYWNPKGSMTFNDCYVLCPLADVDANTLVLSHSDDTLETNDSAKVWSTGLSRPLSRREIHYGNLGSTRTGRHFRLTAQTDRRFKIDATLLDVLVPQQGR